MGKINMPVMFATAGDVGAVPIERKVNGKALSSDITLEPSDVGAAPSSHGNHVPTTESANNAKFLRNDNTWQTVTPANIGAAPSSHNHGAGDINSGTLGVARGGTGATTFSSGAALIGNGTGAVTTRAISNVTTTTTCAASTNLITANTLNYHVITMLNRDTTVTAAETNYSHYKARGFALVTSTPSSITNGCCAFVYA